MFPCLPNVYCILLHDPHHQPNTTRSSTLPRRTLRIVHTKAYLSTRILTHLEVTRSGRQPIEVNVGWWRGANLGQHPGDQTHLIII